MILGNAPDGTEIESVEISQGGTRARLMTYGATLLDFHIAGVPHSLALGSSDITSYFGPLQYFGAIVGPVANRIAGGVAPLDGKPIALATNENSNALHGGPDGISQQVWRIKTRAAHKVTFACTIADGASGLPGPLDIEVCYCVDADTALHIDITAKSAVPTFCNPAFHGYWSLTGQGLGGHSLKIDADHYLPVDEALIPTGEIAPVSGTPFDLCRSTPLPAATHLDTNFCLNGDGMRTVAWLETDALELTIETDAPGLQIYDASRLNTAPTKGHHGTAYSTHAGIAMEPQHCPDAPNHAGFPSITLHPDKPFRQSSRFRFIRKDA